MDRFIIFVLTVAFLLGASSLVGLAAPVIEMEQITTLLEAGFDVDVRDDEGRTALMVAVSSHQNRDVVVYLLETGADPNARDYSGVTPLMYAAFNNDNPEILSILLSEANLNINAYDQSGWTALMHASRNNGPEVLSALLQVGPELEIRNNSGLTALMLAAGFNENPEMITLLTEAGAQVDAQSEPDGWSALMMSSLSDNPNMTKTLLDVGADPSLKSLTGRIAYDYAIESPKIIGTDVFWRLSAYRRANHRNERWHAIQEKFALFLGTRVLPLLKHMSLALTTLGLLILPFTLVMKFKVFLGRMFIVLAALIGVFLWVWCSIVIYLAWGKSGYAIGVFFLTIPPTLVWAVLNSWWAGVLSIILRLFFGISFFRLGRKLVPDNTLLQKSSKVSASMTG